MPSFGNEVLTAKILPFSDLGHSVRNDVEMLRNSHLVPDNVLVSAAIYDVQSGELREVVRS